MEKKKKIISLKKSKFMWFKRNQDSNDFSYWIVLQSWYLWWISGIIEGEEENSPFPCFHCWFLPLQSFAQQLALTSTVERACMCVYVCVCMRLLLLSSPIIINETFLLLLQHKTSLFFKKKKRILRHSSHH